MCSEHAKHTHYPEKKGARKWERRWGLSTCPVPIPRHTQPGRPHLPSSLLALPAGLHFPSSTPTLPLGRAQNPSLWGGCLAPTALCPLLGPLLQSPWEGSSSPPCLPSLVVVKAPVQSLAASCPSCQGPSFWPLQPQPSWTPVVFMEKYPCLSQFH